MKRLLVVLVVLALCVPAWSITGSVVDLKGRPITGAKVTVWTFWTFDRTFHTDKNGSFVYLRRPEIDGRYTVESYRVVDAGGKPVVDATVTMPWYNELPLTLKSDKLGHFDYPLPEPTAAKLRVLSISGKPIPGAKAIAVNRSAGDPVITTDSNGEYVFPRLQNRKVTKRELSFHAIAVGYAYGGTRYTQGQDQPLVIKLHPEDVLKAKVIGEDGAPIKGAKICLSDLTGSTKATTDFDTAGYDMMPVVVTTGKDGAFALHHLPAVSLAKEATVRMTVSAPDRCKLERAVELAELRKSGKIVLPRVCTLEAVVQPPPNATAAKTLDVMMNLQETYGPAAPSGHYGEAAKDGTFKFDNLPPGTATVRILMSRRRLPGWIVPAVKNVRVSHENPAKVTLTGETGAFISGTVRDKATGKPISTAVLNIQDAANPDGESQMADETITDDNGNYSARVAAGKVTIRLQMYFIDKKTVSYKKGKEPTVTLDAANGEERSGLDFEIVPGPNQIEEPQLPEFTE